MNENEILKKLSEFNSKPSKKWQEETLEKLNTTVTNSLDIRNSNMNLNNLNNSLNMNKKFRPIVALDRKSVV